MRILFIAALSICALIIDYQIYVRISRWSKLHPRRRGFIFFYVGYAIAIDILIFAFLILCYRWPFYGPRSVSPIPLWFAWFFLANTLPKWAYILLRWISTFVTQKRVKWVRLVGWVFALYTLFVLLKGAFYNTRHFEVTQVTIESPTIPPSFDGYKMALFSDVHLGNLSRQPLFLAKLIDQVQQLKADIIFHTGDLINMYAFEITPEVQSALSQLSAPDGVFSVLGNHDMGPYFRKREILMGFTPYKNTQQVVERQQEMGWKVLQNESVHIVRGNDSIGLCGVPYPPLPPLFHDSLTNFNLYEATRLLDSAQFNMMLCHTPKVWEEMADSPEIDLIDLMLCGHTHSMQARIQVGSFRWSPSKWLYRYWWGLYERNGHWLYVNGGIGYVLYPLRIGGKPEITLLTLKHK